MRMNSIRTLATGLAMAGAVLIVRPAHGADDAKANANVGTNNGGVHANVKVNAGDGKADPGQNGQTNTADLAFPAGFKMKAEMDEAGDIRSELANLAEDAAQTGHFDNFVGNFVDQDRNRVGEYKDRDF